MTPIRSFSIEAREIEIVNPLPEDAPETPENKELFAKFLSRSQAGYKRMFLRVEIFSSDSPMLSVTPGKNGWMTNYVSAEYPPEPEAKRRAVLECLDRIRTLIANTVGGIDPEQVGKEPV